MAGLALIDLLEQVRRGSLSPQAAAAQIEAPAQADLGYARVDLHRARRHGVPEVIFCQNKSPAQVVGIVGALLSHGQRVLASRASPEQWDAVRAAHPGLQFYPTPRLIAEPGLDASQQGVGRVLVVAAGTADLPVAEEALLTARSCGAKADSLYDVGVAGLHRLLANLESLHQAHVIIVCAGMEGALPSVVGGLVGVPVIAVPTSVGYGASFGGLAALLGMLNSCASNVTVVNIDNGFGAGYVAAMINRQIAAPRPAPPESPC